MEANHQIDIISSYRILFAKAVSSELKIFVYGKKKWARRALTCFTSSKSCATLAPLATDPNGEHTFVTAFLSHWGEALDRAGGRKRRGG